MIIKKIVSICKKQGSVIFFDNDTEQWISDGYAIYPLYSMPKFSETTFCETYDIGGAKRQKMHFHFYDNLPGAYSFKDWFEGESLCERGPIGIVIDNKSVVPYLTSEGVAFIDGAYLSPLMDVVDNMLEIYERHTKDGQMYFAVKSGFMLLALIMPYDCIQDKLVDDLATLHDRCAVALDNKKAAEEENPQINILEEEKIFEGK